MTDATAEITKLERLVKAHRDELKAKREGDAAISPESTADSSTEEQLWETFQIELQNDRFTQGSKQNIANQELEREKFLDRHGLLISLGLAFLLVVVAFVIGGNNLILILKSLAVGAVLLGALSSTCIVAAHRGSVALDGIGKMLALGAAVPAVAAALLLFWLEQ